MTREPVYPDDVICGACHSPRLDRTDKERDGIAWWLSYECPDCGATGDVEEPHNGVTKYHDDVTTPRRADLERASMERRGRL